MIDTSAHGKKQLSFKEQSMEALCNLHQDIKGSEHEAQTRVRATVQTLFKVLTNIQTAPFEQKFRKLPKKSERIRAEVLSIPSACEFLKLAGFEFDKDPEFVELKGWTALTEERVGVSIQNIGTLVESFGGQVHDPNKFDPFKSGITSTTGFNQIGDAAHVNKVKSTMDQIQAIKREREKALETSVADRELTVIKFTNAQANMRQVNMFLAARDKAEEEKKQGKAQETE